MCSYPKQPEYFVMNRPIGQCVCLNSTWIGLASNYDVFSSEKIISLTAPSYPYKVTATTDRLKLVVNISWSLEERSVQEYLTIKLCRTISLNCPVLTYKVWPDDRGVFPTSFAISWSELNSTAGVYSASMSATSHGLNSSETKPSAFQICEFDVTVHSDTRDLLLMYVTNKFRIRC